MAAHSLLNGIALTLAVAAGCSSAGSSAAPEEAGTSRTQAPRARPAERTLVSAHAAHFSVGAAVDPGQLRVHGDLVARHFNRLTPENDMKAGPIHPAADRYDFAAMDRIAEFARTHGMTLTGHALVWHHQQPAWMFEGLTPGEPASIETLERRLRDHVTTLVQRYGDVVDNWDVVNEAISDDPASLWRDGSEGSRWYEIFGSGEYVYSAFRHAREALESRAQGSSEGKLYYNDYNVTLKVDRILRLVELLRERGIDVDGVGLQAHYRIDWPSTREIGEAIDRLAAAGLAVKISELDVSLYDDYPQGRFVPAPAVAFTPELEARQAARYGALFELFRAKSAHVTSVTFWGISDDRTWLDSWPVPGRDNHPLPWNDAHEPKKALSAILDF